MYPNAEVVTFADGESLLAYGQPLDIVFLDIQMQPISGMEAARELRRRGSDVTIIFVTALEEYVYEAFDVNARHYLLKPIDKVKFSEVLWECSAPIYLRDYVSATRRANALSAETGS